MGTQKSLRMVSFLEGDGGFSCPRQDVNGDWAFGALDLTGREITEAAGLSTYINLSDIDLSDNQLTTMIDCTAQPSELVPEQEWHQLNRGYIGRTARPEATSSLWERTVGRSHQLAAVTTVSAAGCESDRGHHRH